MLWWYCCQRRGISGHWLVTRIPQLTKLHNLHTAHKLKMAADVLREREQAAAMFNDEIHVSKNGQKYSNHTIIEIIIHNCVKLIKVKLQ